MRTTVGSSLVALLILALAAPARAQGADPERPYVYQSRGGGPALSGALEYGLGYGTRDTRFFGDRGVEQTLQARFYPWHFLGLQATAGLLVDDRGHPAGAGGVELLARPLWQARHHLDLHLALGWRRDYRERDVLRGSLALSRAFGRVDLHLGSTLEVPLTGAGDAADVMIAAAVSVRVNRWYRQGLELGVEDLEGFWEPREAEGGARLLLGPTAYLELLRRRLELRLNLSAVYSHPTGLAAVAPADRWGFLGRVSIAWILGGRR